MLLLLLFTSSQNYFYFTFYSFVYIPFNVSSTDIFNFRKISSIDNVLFQLC